MHGRAFASRRSAFPRNPSRFPECRDTIKGFAFEICYLHGVMQNKKGAPHLLNPFVHFFCVAQKKWTKEKGAAARCLSGEFLAPALPDAAVARVESDFVGRFDCYFYHSIMSARHSGE